MCLSSTRAALVLALAAVPCASATTVSELARIQGQGESVIQGIGLVVGLNGTGDSGKELAMARPLAAVLANNGSPVAGFDELRNTKTVAVVLVMCTIPAGGARTDDRLDCTVSCYNSATSLEGGMLYLAPLRGPFPNPSVGPYAVAQGPVEIESAGSPRVGKVRLGARFMNDVATGIEAAGSDSFTIVLEPHFQGWGSTAEIAGRITQRIYGKPDTSLGALTPIAAVIDDRSIRITIPEAERANRAGFIADVLATDVDTSLLGLPAQVICNERRGAIIVTGDVELSPVNITHAGLTITTTMPPPAPTPDNPIVTTSRWTSAGTRLTPTQNARLKDLLAAFDQLNIPVTEQIAIISMLHKGGQLHARLVLD